jgi:hypothetical protein
MRNPECKLQNLFPIPNRNADVSPIRRLYKPEAPIVITPPPPLPLGQASRLTNPADGGAPSPPTLAAKPPHSLLTALQLFVNPPPLRNADAPVGITRHRSPVECAASSTGPPSAAGPSVLSYPLSEISLTPQISLDIP